MEGTKYREILKNKKKEKKREIVNEGSYDTFRMDNRK